MTYIYLMICYILFQWCLRTDQRNPQPRKAGFPALTTGYDICSQLVTNMVPLY